MIQLDQLQSLTVSFFDKFIQDNRVYLFHGLLSLTEQLRIYRYICSLCLKSKKTIS